MTEPPRPPGSGNPDDPPAPFHPYAGNEPPPGSVPPPPPTPPPYGYGPQPGDATAPDDKTWILIAHAGGAVGSLVTGGCGSWIAPLVALLARGNQSPTVRAEALKALNFQLLWSVIAVIGICLFRKIVPIAMLVSIIFGVIASVRASNSEPYDYPLTYPLIK